MFRFKTFKTQILGKSFILPMYMVLKICSKSPKNFFITWLWMKREWFQFFEDFDYGLPRITKKSLYYYFILDLTLFLFFSLFFLRFLAFFWCIIPQFDLNFVLFSKAPTRPCTSANIFWKDTKVLCLKCFIQKIN